MAPEQFRKLIAPVAELTAAHSLDGTLERVLEAHFPAAGETFNAIEAACHQAIEAGWMCAQGGNGRRFGRVLEAGEDTSGLSVDVVDLDDIVGPHHRHPRGEVCMVMPVTEGARFDGKGRGWCVYPPNSAHRPTVSEGRALVLYMLPGGEIAFTGQ
ncbi:DUF4863 family protein [Motiliproteus sp. SC1-56]|uniref:4-hydroxylaminobenzoate lyase n=1 Tax=Motiliproteus sp. SC1-56 TaxID=2799565 RepID=UPI001A8E2C6D|nr:DUF4863 family protein [Motiliproteus sp. SC1-56]